MNTTNISSFTGGNDGQKFAAFVIANNIYHPDLTIECYQHLISCGLLKVNQEFDKDSLVSDTFWYPFLVEMERQNLFVSL